MRVAPDPLAPVRLETRTISRRLRVSLWLLAWSLAAAATVEADPASVPLLLFCWMFPMGLAAPFDSSVVSLSALIGGWALYIALSVHGLKQRQALRYFRVYAILVALLILNVAGCRYEQTHMHIGC